MRGELLFLLAVGCPGPDPIDERQVEDFPRCADHDPLRRPFFGDTHVHTTLSLDANLQGTRLTPAEAYRFARGDEVGLQPHDADGVPLRTLQLQRPLDFAMVSDHAEFLGTVDLCSTPGSAAYDDPGCVMFRESPDTAFIVINGATTQPLGEAAWPDLCGPEGADCVSAGTQVWQELQDAAEAAYDRSDSCGFTSFVGWEWSAGPAAKNLHRNVLFRHDQVTARPLGYFDAASPDALLDALTAQCLDQPPCDVLTIPHNSNLSSGLMFERLADTTVERAAARARLEPLVEVFQHKGDSECTPGSAVSDERCGFEKLPYNTLAGANLDIEGPAEDQDFVRDALLEGLRIEAALGVNPYKYGMIASTDTHLGTPGAASETAYPGHGGAGPGAREAVGAGLTDLVAFNPGGLAVVWAEENSREALFRGMLRKETYGTSGPRFVVRMFGGDLPDDLCDDPDLVSQGYDRGVPMGADLRASKKAPRFVVSATADAASAEGGVGLDRVQLVKGWLDGDTVRVEVHDLAVAPAGGAVDATCQVSGPVTTSLCGTWTDEAYDAEVPSFWYARVLEAPTCRWHAHQCVAAGVTCPTDDEDWASCCDTRVETTIQERAWSSPIWSTPG